MTNALLEQVKVKTMERVDPRLHLVVKKIVGAGKDLMYSDKTRHLLIEELRQGNDPEHVGAGVAKLMGLLYNQSKNTIPMQAGIPAATILMCEVLQFMEDSGTVKVDSAFLAECAKAMGSSILQLFGITPDKLQGMINSKGAAASQAAQPAQPAPPPGIVAGARQGAM